MSVADGTGQSRGGHLLDGSTVYTTVEVVLGEMTALAFSREKDLSSGYDELVVRERR